MSKISFFVASARTRTRNKKPLPRGTGVGNISDLILTSLSSPILLYQYPRNPADWNRYTYARDNPIKYTDPSGHHYVYDREGAVSYAMAWDYQAGLDPTYDFTTNPKAKGMDFSRNQCTLFASSVLYEGGVRDPRNDPNPDKLPGMGFLIPLIGI